MDTIPSDAVDASPIDLERAARLSAAALGRALAAGQLDARALTDFLLDRIAGHPDQAVFLRVTAERARREADAAAQRLAEGRPLSPLDGVPIAWKDLVDIADTPTTAGSALLRNAAPATADAPAAANMAAAGMVCLGKVNLTEFAFSGLGLNPHYGTPRNPHDRTTPRAPGGSSSGSAVAVAAGLVPCAIGSDTGGSIRVPASFNGIVGYKSSERRIPIDHVFPLAPSLDTLGPLARSVEDCVLLDMALRGVLTTAARRARLGELSIVVPQNVVLDDLDLAVAQNFERTLKDLEAAGVKVSARRIGAIDGVVACNTAHGTMVTAEAYFVHHATIEGPDVAKVDSRVIDRILLGKKMSARDILTIQSERRRLQALLAAELDGALIAMPATAHTAPAIAPLEADTAHFHAINAKTLRNTSIGNFLNICGVALPNGVDPGGMPTSFLLGAPGGEDERILSAALAAEPVVRAYGPALPF